MIQKKKSKQSTKTAFSFNAMANKNAILLISGNIQTPKFLHQQKISLCPIWRRCVLTDAMLNLRPLRPLHPDVTNRD